MDPAVPDGRIVLRVGAVDNLQISVLSTPYPSISTGLVQIFPGMRCGLPVEMISQMIRRIDRRDLDALRVIGDPTYGVLPDFMQPSFTLGGIDLSVDDSIEALATVPDSVVSAELYEAYGTAPPGPWRKAIDSPNEWVRSVSRATVAAQGVLEPILERHRMLIDHEIDRIGRAVVSGMHDLLLSSLYPRLTWSDGTLVRKHPNAATHDLRGRKIVLVPMLSGMDMLMTNYDLPDAVYICYPIRYVDYSRSGDATHSQLDELLGSGPTAALRQLIRPIAMGRLAVDLQVAPATTTGYIARLERLGLAGRIRTERSVLVTRTARGDALLDLFDSW